MFGVGQNYIYTVCIRYFWQGNHQIYGHIRCIYINGSGHPKYVCVSWIMCVFTGEMISASVWLHLQNRKLNLLKLMAGAWECEKGCGERVRA